MLPLDVLFRGMIYTLKQELAPNLSSPYAKGQAFALITILSHLSVSVENMAQYLIEENNDLKESLNDVIEIVDGDKNSLKEEAWVNLIQKIRNHLKKQCPPFYGYLIEENKSLREILVDVIETLEANKSYFQKDTLAEVRQRIRSNLRAQLNRELLVENSICFDEILADKVKARSIY